VIRAGFETIGAIPARTEPVESLVDALEAPEDSLLRLG
jgi:hypothetical protein